MGGKYKWEKRNFEHKVTNIKQSDCWALKIICFIDSTFEERKIFAICLKWTLSVSIMLQSLLRKWTKRDSNRQVFLFFFCYDLNWRLVILNLYWCPLLSLLDCIPISMSSGGGQDVDGTLLEWKASRPNRAWRLSQKWSHSGDSWIYYYIYCVVVINFFYIGKIIDLVCTLDC